MKKLYCLPVLLLAIIWAVPAFAQDFSRDLALEEDGLRTENSVIVGRTVKIYAKVQNNSERDLFGVVKFYDEIRQEFIGEDQPVSVIAGSTDDVFVDWEAGSVGNFPISARVIPWQEEGDNPDNNKTTTSIYVDVDSDGDGIPNRQDPDDDNDGIPDSEDAFPLDPSESADTDGDGTGNNADEDDDGDGVQDIQDSFPTDASETVDTDNDGTGDNADVFPTDPSESADSDQDGLGDNADPDSANKGPIPFIDTENSVVSSGSTVTFNALKSNDPDGEIVSYEWDFGEGVASTSVIVDHIFEKPGRYEVKLKVIDDKGEYRTGIMAINVIYRWQTVALILITLFLFLLLIYNIKNTKKALAKKKKKK
jgi:hypothetical protein